MQESQNNYMTQLEKARDSISHFGAVSLGGAVNLGESAVNLKFTADGGSTGTRSMCYTNRKDLSNASKFAIPSEQGKYTPSGIDVTMQVNTKGEATLADNLYLIINELDGTKFANGEVEYTSLAEHLMYGNIRDFYRPPVAYVKHSESKTVSQVYKRNVIAVLGFNVVNQILDGKLRARKITPNLDVAVRSSDMSTEDDIIKLKTNLSGVYEVTYPFLKGCTFILEILPENIGVYSESSANTLGATSYLRKTLESKAAKVIFPDCGGTSIDNCVTINNTVYASKANNANEGGNSIVQQFTAPLAKVFGRPVTKEEALQIQLTGHYKHKGAWVDAKQISARMNMTIAEVIMNSIDSQLQGMQMLLPEMDAVVFSGRLLKNIEEIKDDDGKIIKNDVESAFSCVSKIIKGSASNIEVHYIDSEFLITEGLAMLAKR